MRRLNDSIFPKFEKPRKLLVAEIGSLNYHEKVALTILEGLINRVKPQIYLVSNDVDRFWLTYYRERHGVEIEAVDPSELLERYVPQLDGYIVYDTNFLHTLNVASTIGSIKNCLPVSSELAKKLADMGIEKVDDLRNKWNNRLEAYKWALNEVFEECNKRIAGNMCVHLPRWPSVRFGIRDYLVAVKAFTFDLSASPRDRADYKLRDEIISGLESPGVILGWHCCRDTEKEHVAQAAKHGLFVLCSPHASNLTVHASMEVEAKYRQRVLSEEDVKVEDKVYVTFLMTDGDAIWAMEDLQAGNWLRPERGRFPFNWGLQPLLYDLAPAILNYYYETKTENDYFFTPVSGAGYTYPFLHPDPRRFLEYSREYALKAGTEKCYNIVNWDPCRFWGEAPIPEFVDLEKEVLKEALGVFRGFGGSTYIDNYVSEDFVNIHSAYVVFRNENVAGDLKYLAMAIKERPAFIFAYVQIAKDVLETVYRAVKELDPATFKIVLADEFILAMRKAAKEGKIRKTWAAPFYPDNEMLREYVKKDGLQRRWKRVIPQVEFLRQLLDKNPDAILKIFEEKWGECSLDELPDVIAYNAAVVCLDLVRAALHINGIYSNVYDTAVALFKKVFKDKLSVDVADQAYKMMKDWDKIRVSLHQALEFTEKVVKLADDLSRIVSVELIS